MKIGVSKFVFLFLVIAVTTPEAEPLAAAAGGLASFLLATKVALTPPAAFAGLITGIIGTVLGGISIKLHLQNLAELEAQKSHFGKRSLDDLQKIREAEAGVDAFLDKAYQSDLSRCLEKLICSIARSRSARGVQDLSQVEESLVEMARHPLGFASKRMEAALKAGLGQSNCDILFDSCPLNQNLMISYIEAMLQRASNEPLYANKYPSFN